MGNEEQRDYWDRRAEVWDRRSSQVDAASDPYGQAALEALAAAPGERILDIGCGTGRTTNLIAGLVGPEGEAVGVDIAPSMVAAAQRNADREGLTNATFHVADAQSDPLGAGFDAVFSRFGVMFFADRAKAFSNIGAAVKPGGRLAFAVWGAVQDNPWMTLPTMAAADVLGVSPPVPEPDDPGPFVLADPVLIEQLLHPAGFNGIQCRPVEAEREVPRDGEFGLRFLLEIGPLADDLAAADAATKDRVVEAVVQAVSAYEDGDGWRFPASAICISAVRG